MVRCFKVSHHNIIIIVVKIKLTTSQIFTYFWLFLERKTMDYCVYIFDTQQLTAYYTFIWLYTVPLASTHGLTCNMACVCGGSVAVVVQRFILFSPLKSNQPWLAKGDSDTSCDILCRTGTRALSATGAFSPVLPCCTIMYTPC